MDPFNSTFNTSHPSPFNASSFYHPPSPSTASLLAHTLGLSSLATMLGSGGGAGGIAGLSILLSSVLPLLMSSSSWARGFILAPGRWLLDFFFVTAFIETSSPVSAWLSSYLSSLPKILTSKEVGVEVVKDVDAELAANEEAPKEFDPYSGRSVSSSVDQNQLAARLHRFRLTPFASSHTLLIHENHLLVISKTRKPDYALVKDSAFGAGAAGGRGQMNHPGSWNGNGMPVQQSQSGDQETEFLKIRFIPLPHFPFLPSFSRSSSNTSSPRLTSQKLLDSLISTSKLAFAAKDARGLSVYSYDFKPEMGIKAWTGKTTRGKRSIESVVLPKGIGGMLLRDVKDFLARKEWYQERGIPHRRGILLYGEAGSGKTSIVSAISSELSLNIYVLDLSADDMTDASMLAAIAQTPPNCIILIEDIDCAFAPRKASTVPVGMMDPVTRRYNDGQASPQLTMSGLLNALDGVASVDGRITMATTNHLNRLDPALIRPGRFDIKVGFSLATRDQSIGLFLRMMLPTKGEIEREIARRAAVTSIIKEEDDSIPLVGSVDEKNKVVEAGGEGEGKGEFAGEWHEEKTHRVKRLSEEFGRAVPEGVFSTASLQGYLLRHKDEPEAAVEGVAAWVIEQRQLDEDQRKAADADWELKLKLKARDEKKKEREAQKAKEKAEKAEKSDDDEDDASGSGGPSNGASSGFGSPYGFPTMALAAAVPRS